MPVASFPLSREAIEQSLPDRYAQVVARFPDRIAIDSQEARLSYRALDEISNRWARLVLDRATHGAVVGLLVPQGPDNVAATLGILKAGALYAPFDPSHSFDRLEATVAHAAPALIIAASPYRDLAASLVGGSGAVCALGDERASPADAVPSKASADSRAYLFYTSGSSGPPKGVVDTHRNVLHNVWRYTANLCITEADRLSMIQPPSFSACVSSQFCALMNGATLLPYDVRTAGLGRPLREWIQRERVTVFHAVPRFSEPSSRGSSDFPTCAWFDWKGTPRGLGMPRSSADISSPAPSSPTAWAPPKPASRVSIASVPMRSAAGRSPSVSHFPTWTSSSSARTVWPPRTAPQARSLFAAPTSPSAIGRIRPSPRQRFDTSPTGHGPTVAGTWAEGSRAGDRIRRQERREPQGARRARRYRRGGTRSVVERAGPRRRGCHRSRRQRRGSSGGVPRGRRGRQTGEGRRVAACAHAAGAAGMHPHAIRVDGAASLERERQGGSPTAPAARFGPARSGSA